MMGERLPILCHRTFAMGNDADGEGAYNCVGSRCAMWSPEVEKRSGSFTSIEGGSEPCWSPLSQPYSLAKDAGDIVVLTGRGWCADNPNRQPWKDPAS